MSWRTENVQELAALDARLAQMIREFWAERGQIVKLTVHPGEPVRGADGSVSYVVGGIRSDMINGLPVTASRFQQMERGRA